MTLYILNIEKTMVREMRRAISIVILVVFYCHFGQNSGLCPISSRGYNAAPAGTWCYGSFKP